MAYTNVSGYQFRKFSNLESLRETIKNICAQRAVKGTILLAEEGINLFLSAEYPVLQETLAAIMEHTGFFEVKESESLHVPFNRMLVKIKKEIVTMGKEGFDVHETPSKYVTPAEFKKWMDEGRDILILDTRNDYECRLGKFTDALEMGLKTFREFPDMVAQFPEEWKERTIVTFCTGGIRCEKAAPWMVKAGFKNVYQLEGGILKYFEEMGSAHYDGDCFVFDRRVAVDPALQQTDTVQCFVCRQPVTVEEQVLPSYVYSVSCPHCFNTRVQHSTAAQATI